MNRAFRRALARAFAKAPKPTPEQERLDALEAENQRLRAEVDGLHAKQDALPGVKEGRRDWFVIVGGERVDLKAIPPAAWISSLEELPSFLMAFAIERSAKPDEAPAQDTLDKVVELAKRWIQACAVDLPSVYLDHLTLPEAQHAVAHIAELNGVTAALRQWFQQRLAGVAPGAPGSEPVRGEAEQPPGSQLN